MTFRCLTCGFAQDFDPTDEAKVVACHPWMKEKPNKQDCPSCHQYLDRGGRRRNKIENPGHTTVGLLEDQADPTVLTKFTELVNDWNEMGQLGLSKARKTVLKEKYGAGNLIFGYTGEEKITLTEEYEAALPEIRAANALGNALREAMEEMEKGNPPVDSQGRSVFDLRILVAQAQNAEDTKFIELRNTRPARLKPTN